MIGSTENAADWGAQKNTGIAFQERIASVACLPGLQTREEDLQGGGTNAGYFVPTGHRTLPTRTLSYCPTATVQNLQTLQSIA